MREVNLALALHFHQPVGNFEDVVERAYQSCYRPFLELLSQYPDLTMMFHVSGSLLDFLEDKHPEIFKLLRSMAARGQIQMMGGAYYDPILPAIPARDIKGQIRMMSGYIEKKFGRQPAGMWIPERVWQPDLAGLLYEAGVRYAVLDDTHLNRAGVKHEDMHGYFLTGKGTKKIAIFPSDKVLRYAIPFKYPNETIEYLRAEGRRAEGLLFTYGDDGEKFGEWPGTHDWVYKQNWLRDFFEALRQNKDWLRLTTLPEYLKNHKPLGSLEIPQGSYEEMMEWSGGNWMNFLIKYPEADQMRRKMISVSDKINSGDTILNSKSSKGELSIVSPAQRELYRGQCNCAYWHGVFGGLYLYHLRRAVYEHLIAADNAADRIIHRKEKKWLDVKLDKENSTALLSSETLSLSVDAQRGGVMTELDYRPLCANLINTLSRKPEAYHKKIIEAVGQQTGGAVATIHDDHRTVPAGLKEKIVYDAFPRHCLRTYFDQIGDFADAPYSIKTLGGAITMEHGCPLKDAAVKLTKQIRIASEKTVEMTTVLDNIPAGLSDAVLVVEFNITMPYLDAPRYHYVDADQKLLGGMGQSGESRGGNTFGIRDREGALSIIFHFSQAPQDIWYFPVETVSQSERAYELNFQGSCIAGRWRPAHAKGKKWALTILWEMV